MKLRTLFIICMFMVTTNVAIAQSHLSTSQRQASEAEAVAIINRFTGNQLPIEVNICLDKVNGERDVFSYETQNGKLIIKASSGVAACRGFYDYVKSRNLGLSTWTGNRFNAPDDIQVSPKEFVSPYKHHQYLNVVTYGYTAPYWNQERWDKEIDWMALHGIDMPLLLIAQEAIYRMVFADMGLSSGELDEWEVGPAHLPWMRMGNLAGNSFDGPLGEAWHSQQIALCKHVITRMRKLGMEPICPAFGGFVPKAFAEHRNEKTDVVGWDWVPIEHRNYRLNPASKAFEEIGTRFIKKWEKTFGRCSYYLSDSFNEMQIPNDTTLMTAYGDAIYRSIAKANANAVWVMQGWTLGYQRGSWGNGIFKSLVKNVPDNKFMILDMATDYNRCLWNMSYDWDYYDGFYGKQWLWSVIPNMGGKTALTGVLNYYANSRIDAWKSPNRGNLIGYGMAPEGIENNELLYELITDAGWCGATDSIHVDNWLRNYMICRYGDDNPANKLYTNALQNSVYSAFQDHPQFAWQVHGNIIGAGNVNVNEHFSKAVLSMFSDATTLSNRLRDLSGQGAELYRADMIEMAAMYVSKQIENCNLRIRKTLEKGDTVGARDLLNSNADMMMRLDRALTAHPLYNLERWEQYAMDVANTDAQRKRNAVNARRIVSVWYGHHQANEPVNDYACRLWAGLIRDYYLPRMVGKWNELISGEKFDKIALENQFVDSAPYLSHQDKIEAEELPAFLCQLVIDASCLGSIEMTSSTQYELSDGPEKHWYIIRCTSGNSLGKVLTLNEDGSTRFDVDAKSGEQLWIIYGNSGQHEAQSRWGGSIAVKAIKEDVRFDAVPDAYIPEVMSKDFTRYEELLESYGSNISKKKYEEARAMLNAWKQDISHRSYNEFLIAWSKLWE
ncbi:MAG: alpha-N-acetylglucosaminidase TIM-barrel domain-containing protein [Muribaculaceae bacterium]